MCKCGRPNRYKQRNCHGCHAANMRRWRKTHPLNGLARVRMISRVYANVYQRRGKLIPQPCEVIGCGDKAEKHHDNYKQPLKVRWMCRPHHLSLHKEVKV